jgi:hypothetical protein
MVEMWKNYHPNIPIEYQSDVLYDEPSAEVFSKVKLEKEDRSEFRAKMSKQIRSKGANQKHDIGCQ